MASGANGIDGVSFGLSNPKPMQDDARLQAVVALRSKSQLYAFATGLRVLRLINLTEGSDGAPPPQPMFKAMAGRARIAEAVTPVEGGEIEVRVTLSATYELAR